MIQAKYLLLVPVLALTLTGCTNVQTDYQKSIENQQLYQGYPCGDTCADFQIGYDQAKASDLKAESECQGNNLAQITGCKAYISDFTFDNQPSPILAR